MLPAPNWSVINGRFAHTCTCTCMLCPMSFEFRLNNPNLKILNISYSTQQVTGMWRVIKLLDRLAVMSCFFMNIVFASPLEWQHFFGSAQVQLTAPNFRQKGKIQFNPTIHQK